MTPTGAAWLLAAALLAASAEERAVTEQRLIQVRAELEALHAERQRLSQEEATLLLAVEEADRAVAASLARERALERELAASEARLQQATDELAEQQKAVQVEAARLAAIARLAFLLSHDAPRVSLLLPERGGERGRALAVLAYLKRERARLIGRLRASAAESARLQAETEAAMSALWAQREALRTERQRLEEAQRDQRERARALRGLRQSAEARAAALDREAAALTTLLERLADVFADLPPFMAGTSLAARRGALPWPVTGEVVERFAAGNASGRPRPALGIAAEEGAPVRAVAHGRVVFADWLPGLGMLIVLDHGEGFLSLYGHLGTLLVEVGEWVEEGQTVGLVGRSGGVDRAKLHFELRRGAEPLDPQAWLAVRGRP